MLAGLFVTPAVTAISEALGSANAEGPIAVVGNARLAAALAATREVIAVGLSPRAAKKLANTPASRQASQSPWGTRDDVASIDPTSLAAVIGVDVTGDETWPETLRTWTRAVRDGGAIVFVDKGRAAEASRRALCAGLSELEQRHAGRTVITSGLVTHLARD